MPSLTFAQMVPLLRRRFDDPAVTAALGIGMRDIERSEYLGFHEWHRDGLDVIYTEAPWVLPEGRFANPKDLHVQAFHMHRQGHEEFDGYAHELPGRVHFGDSRDAIIRVFGPPARSGGGEYDELFDGKVPEWIAYDVDGNSLHFQFDDQTTLELVTIEAPDPNGDD